MEFNHDSQFLAKDSLQETQVNEEVPPQCQSILNEPTPQVYRLGKYKLIREQTTYSDLKATPNAAPTASAIPRDILMQVSNGVQVERCNVDSTVKDKPPLPPQKRRRLEKKSNIEKEVQIENEFIPTTYAELYACWESGGGMPVITRADTVQLSQNYGGAPQEYRATCIAFPAFFDHMGREFSCGYLRDQLVRKDKRT